MRMDATTNWAIGTTAAVATFAVGNASVPHFGIFVAPLLTSGFLLLEARRLRFYHLWQQRVLRLERGLIAPALDPAIEPVALESLAPELGRTVPTMSLGKAVARRLRRVYSHLFVAQAFAWVLKLASQAGADGSLDEILVHARIGALPGVVVVGLVAVATTGALVGGWLRGGVERAAPESR
jgi:uncharacterized membrane protein